MAAQLPLLAVRFVGATGRGRGRGRGIGADIGDAGMLLAVSREESTKTAVMMVLRVACILNENSIVAEVEG